MEIIRQTEYLSNIPLQKKLATLEELYHRPGNPFSVHELCDALDVARVGPSTTTSSVRRTEANTKRNKLSSC